LDRRRHDPAGAQSGPRAAALPFVALALLLLVGASTTMLPAGFAFALIVACVLIGALRVLLVYRDVLVARRPRGVAH
jgi:hypothetical protein